MSLISLGNLIKKTTGKSVLARQVDVAMVLEKFGHLVKEIWGEEMTERIQGISINNGVLNIACLSSSAAQEVKLREQEILDKINEGKERPIVERVRIQM